MEDNGNFLFGEIVKMAKATGGNVKINLNNGLA